MKKLRGADDSGSRRFITGSDRLRELGRIAGDLGADEIVHDAVALAERADAPPDLMDAALSRYGDRLVFEITERRAALMRPKALSGSHAAEMRAAIQNAQQWLRDIAAEADGFEQPLREDRERFLATIDRTTLPAGKKRRDAIDQANAIAAERVHAWAMSVARRMKALHAETVERHAAAVRSLVERIRQAGVPIEGDLAVETAFVPKAIEPHRVPATFKLRRAATEEETMAVFREAMTVGSQRVLDAFHEAVTLSLRRLEWEVALRLRATADALKRAADIAAAAQAEGPQAIANELNRIDDLAKRLGKL
jgi:hypothetical protein